MKLMFTRTVLILAMFFGMTGGAYALTENSLPDSPLFEAKLAMEQFQLQMKKDPVDAAGYHLILAQHRIQEAIQLAQAGNQLHEGLMTKLHNHLNTAFQLAAQMGDEGEMQGVLTKAQNMLQEQIHQMTQAQAQLSNGSQEQLQLMIQLMTQAQIQAGLGLQDPAAFRWQYQHQTQKGQQPDPLIQTSTESELCDGCVPIGDENKYGPQPDQPGPGQQGGNPDCPECPCEECVPIGDENKYGQQSETDDSAQPKGSSECICETCVPEGDENHNGPQPEQPGPGQPGGNPDCEECEPDGDQNQNGKK